MTTPVETSVKFWRAMDESRQTAWLNRSAQWEDFKNTWRPRKMLGVGSCKPIFWSCVTYALDSGRIKGHDLLLTPASSIVNVKRRWYCRPMGVYRSGESQGAEETSGEAERAAEF